MREFWDGLARFFGYDFWDWGSAGEWTSAIGTILAFGAALWVIVSERNKSNLELANLFVTSLSSGGEKNWDGAWKQFTMRVDVFNGGSLPIQKGMFYAPADQHEVSRVPFSARNDDKRGGVSVFDDKLPRVLPNERFDLTWKYAGQVDGDRFYVEFTDGRGRTHYRRMADNKTVRRLPKEYRKLGPLRTPRRLSSEKALEVFIDQMQPEDEETQGVADR